MTESLVSLLTHQHEQLTALQEIQALELQALEQRDAPALEQHSQRKGVLLSAIEATDKTIAQHPDREQLNANPEIAELRSAIESLLAVVRQQNEVNGQVIRLTLGRIHTLRSELQTLHGTAAGTYNEKGRTSSGLGEKSIKA